MYMVRDRAEKLAYFLALFYVVYMPLHIFLSQWLSTFTGGLEVWKAAKDVLLVLAVFPLLYVAYVQGAFLQRFFRWFIGLGVAYVLLYMLFLLFDKRSDTTAAITGAVYNTRLLGYFLLGWVVAHAKHGAAFTKNLWRVAFIMCGVVAALGIMQYILPKDFLTHFGYSIERGVKPMFFINEDITQPRIMSTLRDPNSLGAFLLLGILISFVTLLRNKMKKIHVVVGGLAGLALLLSLSRAAMLGAVIASVALLFGTKIVSKVRKKQIVSVGLVTFLVLAGLMVVFKDSSFVRSKVLRINDTNSAVELDSDDYHVHFVKEGLQAVVEQPLGHGPGTAGIVSISNSEGTFLTENYYIQIAYEIGVLGLIIFTLLYLGILRRLYKGNSSAQLLCCLGIAYGVMSFVMHLWSNEAVALQWWLLAGIATKNYSSKNQLDLLK